MAEKLNLNRFKSSGVYTVEIDESTNLSLPISTGRLIVGSSKKGPINSVVAVNNLRTRLAVYGEIDTKLEKNGSYFHRTIDIALREGPVFALNLIPVNDEDKAYFGTFNTESASNNSVLLPNLFISKISDFYNTQKLWFASIDQLNKTKNLALGDLYVNSSTNYGALDKDANKILSFVNLGKKDVTIWTRVADVTGYDLTVSDYYKLLGQNVEIPEYLHVDDIVSDFFVEAIAVEGNWTDCLKLSKDPVYSQYFTESGLIISKINDFVSLREVTLLNKTIGCIIPDFRDLTNANVSIDRVFNRAFPQTGVFCALDFGKVDVMDLTKNAFAYDVENIRNQRLDLVGHGFDENQYWLDADATIKTPLVDVLSHRKAADNNFQFRINDINATLPEAIAGQSHVIPSSTSYAFTPSSTQNITATITRVNNTTLTITGAGVDLSADFAVGKYLLTTTAGTYVAISARSYTPESAPGAANDVLTVTHEDGVIANVGALVDGPFNVYTRNEVLNNTYIAAYEGGEIWNAWKKGCIKTGDKSGANYIKIDGLIKKSEEINYVEVLTFSDAPLTNRVNISTVVLGTAPNTLYVVNITTSGDKFKNTFDLTNTAYFSGSHQYFAPNKISFTLHPNLYGNVAKGEPENGNYDSAKRLEVDEFFKVGQYIKAAVSAGRPRLLKITSVVAQKVTVNSSTTLKYTVTTAAPTAATTLGFDLTSNLISVYKGIKNFSKHAAGINIGGLKWAEADLFPNGTAARQDAILDFMYEYNIASTLADGETLDYRYVIDSYEGQVSSSAKSALVQLAADHGKALAILNNPSFAQLERSTDPSFINPVTKLVSAEYIAAGGDLTQNPSFQAGFASGEKNGIPFQSYAAYFMPNLIIQENGRNKSVPPAAYVSNVFMKKYRSGNTFSIAAGKRGVITDPEVVGIEYDLTNEDRDFLEPAGHNLIVRRRGFGIMVFSNNTAYQRVRSALNNIHVREALVTIEKDVERILINFLFDFNDEITRLRVKTLVKNYLEAVKDARGIASYDIVFDESNNGPEVLENNTGIIDIIIDFPRGIHKFINRITITRVGGQLSSQSSGFTPSF